MGVGGKSGWRSVKGVLLKNCKDLFTVGNGSKMSVNPFIYKGWDVPLFRQAEVHPLKKIKCTNESENKNKICNYASCAF